MVMSKDPLILLGTRVRGLRLTREVSQEELATLADLDRRELTGQVNNCKENLWGQWGQVR
jgi:hypothetical protein